MNAPRLPAFESTIPGVSPRFDWYQATVLAEPAELLAACRGLDGVNRSERVDRVRHGFRFGEKVSDSEGVVCQLAWGGAHEAPHVVFTGERAVGGAEFLRGQFAHRVSRCDVAQDFAEPGAFDVLQAAALRVADQFKVTIGTAGDHLLRHEGRTIYVGSTKAVVMGRIYDKADELRHKFAQQPQRLAEVPRHLSRLEMQIRPQTADRKEAASKLAPLELMGSSRWARELLRLLVAVELDPVDLRRPWRQSDDQRAYAALLAQYGGLLRRLEEELGSWDCVGLQIGSDLAARDACRARMESL